MVCCVYLLSIVVHGQMCMGKCINAVDPLNVGTFTTFLIIEVIYVGHRKYPGHWIYRFLEFKKFSLSGGKGGRGNCIEIEVERVHNNVHSYVFMLSF